MEETTQTFNIEIPDLAVVLLIGVSGSGKSTFAKRHFLPTEVLSSDAFRAMVSDNENDQSATTDAFAALHTLAAIRLRRRKLVVIDATNVQPDARKPLLELARQHDCLPVAIVLNVPERTCQDRNKARPDRQFGPHVIANQQRQLRSSLKLLRREGFRYIFTLNEDQIGTARVTRVPLWTDRRNEVAPFDIIGDVHGCYDELTALLTQLGYAPDAGTWKHPQGRRAVFLGDLVDRGPKVVETVRLVMAMVAAGTALCVPGNHDDKLKRALMGHSITVSHGLQASLDQIAALPDEERDAFKKQYITFADALISHFWLDEGKLCVAHAGMKEEYIGRASGRVRDFALYGETTGETDEFGLPVRYLWADDYRGATTVVYGHTPVPEADWLNNTLNIDTGCVFGGKLTALRWPERTMVQVKAHATYAESARPLVPSAASTPEPANIVDALDELQRAGSEQDRLWLEAHHLARALVDQATASGANELIDFRIDQAARALPEAEVGTSQTGAENPQRARSSQWEHDELLRAEDVLGKRFIETRLSGRITVPAENAAAALEVMSRFAVEPRWLIYLPPTMSPCETAPEGDLLERPEEAFAYFRGQGVEQVVCQRKHMGSRAVLVVCRDESSARKRFGTGAQSDVLGQCYTRTGRQFFDEPALHAALLQEVVQAITRAGLWEELRTDWICLDAELMPWNAKAQGLLREQYAPVGAAARTSLAQSVAILEQAIARGLNVADTLNRLQQRQQDIVGYTEAYARYCWDVGGLSDLRLAPFHLLATEGRTYFDRDHSWHIATLARLAEQSPLFLATETRTVETRDENSCAEGVSWWHTLTEAGGEGMVVKPLRYIVRGPKGMVQPAVKVRGREYLRIIYGPEYTEPGNIDRLRKRGLSGKRSLALREFGLGVEGLERFVRREPLRRVHECAFGVLALESEPIDPRL